MKKKICPKCGEFIKGRPAISREDNKTEICSNCGVIEALEDFKKSLEKGEWSLNEKRPSNSKIYKFSSYK